jgi:methylated-DNA-protein-cysteine methyltransferase-like protein
MNIYDKIYEAVKQIPKGKVASYGQIALVAAGTTRYSRVVGYALHANPDPANIPCHRVVNRFGGLSSAFAFGGGNRQKTLLEQEGVVFSADNNVDMKKYSV